MFTFFNALGKLLIFDLSSAPQRHASSTPAITQVTQASMSHTERKWWMKVCAGLTPKYESALLSSERCHLPFHRQTIHLPCPFCPGCYQNDLKCSSTLTGLWTWPEWTRVGMGVGKARCAWKFRNSWGKMPLVDHCPPEISSVVFLFLKVLQQAQIPRSLFPWICTSSPQKHCSLPIVITRWGLTVWAPWFPEFRRVRLSASVHRAWGQLWGPLANPSRWVVRVGGRVG